MTEAAGETHLTAMSEEGSGSRKEDVEASSVVAPCKRRAWRRIEQEVVIISKQEEGHSLAFSGEYIRNSLF